MAIRAWRQFAVLELIGANRGVSQIDLALTLGTDRATMKALVDKLTARNLVTRQQSRCDRRRKELTLTPGGRDLLGAAASAVAAHEARYLSLFSAGELNFLTEGLRRIYAAR